MTYVNILKRRDKIIVSRVRYPSRTNTMSSKTKDFIQKICYKKPQIADMTRYGFVNNRSNFAYVMLKPLKAQLEKILGHRNSDKIIIPRTRLSANSPRGFLKSKSKRTIGQYSLIGNGHKISKTSSVQAQPYAVKTKKMWVRHGH